MNILLTLMKLLLSYTPSASTKSARSSLSRSSKHSVGSENCEEYLILFGLPETKNLIVTESKLLVDEILEFLAGKLVQIRDLFRLGKSNRSFPNSSLTRPGPIFIKLVAWDPKPILLRKCNLKNFKVKNLFVREYLSIKRRLKSS